jgi:thiol:disulfide interchange protein DsbC
MSRVLTRFLILAAALLPFAVSAADADELASVRATITTMFDAIKPEDVNPSPVPGWYTIHTGPIVAYVSADGRYLLQGDMIDLVTQVNLSEKTRTDARKALLAGVSDDDVIAFSPDEKKYSVTIFTDVDCTYCRKLHNEIDQYMAKGIEVRYMLYPRSGPATRSWTTAENVWCAQDRNHALTMAKRDEGFASSQCDASMISRHYKLGRDVGLSGTPAIVLDDGTLIGGYLPPAVLLQRIEASAPATP